MSAQLNARAIDHVVLEAGDIGERWRRERWDSLRLLTPNWMLNLPEQHYGGDDPDGFMSKDALADYLRGYAHAMRAPVKCFSRVHEATVARDGYRLLSTQGEWRCRALVLASGAHARAAVPRIAAQVPASVTQLTAQSFRRSADVPPGKVLVVGASATGLQLAQELNAAGRDVTLAVGEHVRMPRRVAGRDVYWWLMQSGVFWESASAVDDLERARRLPSPQLVGDASAELNHRPNQQSGVEIVGRFAGVSQGQAQFSGNLAHLCKAADLKLERLLRRFATAVPGALEAADLTIEATQLDRPRLSAGLGSEIKVLLWATGFEPDYRWLQADVLDRKGRLRHEGGVAAAPGLYALGLPLMRHRASTFVAGAEPDSWAVAEHLHGYLSTSRSALAISDGAPG